MAFSKLDKPKMWLITLYSKQKLSDRDRDFIADLVSEEARKVIEKYYFILHEIIESEKYSKIFIEGTKVALSNLLLVIRDNLPYQVAYEYIGSTLKIL